MTRRRFAFWLGLGLFGLAERLQAGGLDELAAAIIRDKRDPEPAEDAIQVELTSRPEHWVVSDNKAWWWYERQNLIEGEWTLTGITTPINKKTSEPYTGQTGYLDDSLVPQDVRVGDEAETSDFADQSLQVETPGEPDPARKARHGRPPSKWLRRLYSEELRIWLKTIDVPEADVSGMTFWTHLTRDHSFEAENIEGLSIEEQAQLHAAAHFGY